MQVSDRLIVTVVLLNGIVKPVLYLAVVQHFGPGSIAAIAIDPATKVFHFKYNDPFCGSHHHINLRKAAVGFGNE